MWSERLNYTFLLPTLSLVFPAKLWSNTVTEGHDTTSKFLHFALLKHFKWRVLHTPVLTATRCGTFIVTVNTSLFAALCYGLHLHVGIVQIKY